MVPILPASARRSALGESEGLGRVHMAISCSHRAAQQFDRGLALLYSFWYDRALSVFDSVIASDPQCAIGYWGAAMTFNHPLWSPPTATDLRGGLRYLAKGAHARERGDEEARFFNAAQVLFGDANPAHKNQRDEAYLQRMKSLYAVYRDDNAALFYALALEGSYGYAQSPAKIELAGKLAEHVRAKQPMHPGALHYIIHAYDNLGYEDRALSAARAYAASAPSVPHALHMPSHTFSALGLWSEANATNERAWRSEHEALPDLHTLWFLTYGYSQVGKYRQAHELAQKALAQYASFVKLYPSVPADVATDRYDMLQSLSPALTYAVQTGDYSMRVPSDTQGLPPLYVLARMQYQMMQAFQSHDTAAAKQQRDAIVSYATLSAASAAPQMVRPINLVAHVSTAMYDLQSGGESAMAELAAAANEETQVPVHLPLVFSIPAHEAYGRELLRRGQYSQAEQELKAALARHPNRTHALLWLAQAAAANHDQAVASSARATFDSLWTAAAALADSGF